MHCTGACKPGLYVSGFAWTKRCWDHKPHQDSGVLAAVGDPASQQNAKHVRPGRQHDPVAWHLRAGPALAWFTQRCARSENHLGHIYRVRVHESTSGTITLSKFNLHILYAAHTAVCDRW